MDIKKQIQEEVLKSLEALGIEAVAEDIVVEVPDDKGNGHYSTNIAMRLASQEKSNPRDLAQKIIDGISGNENIEKVELAGPGFINFFVSDRYLLKYLSEVLKNPEDLFQLDEKKGKTIVIEYTDPNPFKILHIGHLYTNCVGESFARLQEALGADVKRANYQGDIGLHVAKTLYGLDKKLKEDGEKFSDIEKLELKERVEYLGEAYILGTDYYDNRKDAESVVAIDNLNYYIASLSISSLEEKELSGFDKEEVKGWYVKGRQWCLDAFEDVYERSGTHFDNYFFESQVGDAGLAIVKKNVGTVFEEDDGAIIYRGDESKGLHTRVFVNKMGVPTYEGKELGLFEAKAERFDYDESVIITADEQSGYFKVVLGAVSRIMPEYANVTTHMPHGMVKLPGAKKMSSREGNILTAEWLLDETKKKVADLMSGNDREYVSGIDEISEKVSIASIKHAFLKVGVGKDVVFDFDEAISFDGNTGPYLLYVYARCNSMVNDSDVEPNGLVCLDSCVDNAYVKDLTLALSNYRDTLLGSAVNYSPSMLVQYMFDLGKSFNNFYQNVRVLDAPKEEQQLLINIVYATMYTMKDGLKNLGIEVVEEM